MIIQWILAITILISAMFLAGLCMMLFRFYSSQRHRYRIHIALMSAADVLFTGLIIGQLLAGMFGFSFPQWTTIVLIYLALWLKIGGLFRMFWHRQNEDRLRK